MYIHTYNMYMQIYTQNVLLVFIKILLCNFYVNYPSIIHYSRQKYIHYLLANYDHSYVKIS